MTESEFDALLRRALIDVIHEDYADILEGEPDVPPHTEKYLRRKRKLLADPIGYVRRLARPVWKKTLRMVACILLALATLFGSVMALSPSARAWVVRMYTEWREEFTKFSFFGSSGQSSVPADWRPTFLPDGYTFESKSPVGNVVLVTYVDMHGNTISFYYRLLHSDGAFNVDNEHGIEQKITIGSSPATLLTSNIEGYRNRLVWMNEDEDTAFMLTGRIDSNDLVAIAESVEKII